MRANTDWFRDCKWGLFGCYLCGEAGDGSTGTQTAQQWNQQVDAVDVDALGQQIASTGAGYFFITVGQNSGHWCSPNATYDSIVGIQPSKCSQRDLVADLYRALEPYGVRLMVYAPSGAPDNDPVAIEKLEWINGKYPDYAHPNGAPADDPDDRNVNFQLKWEAIITEWSQRWGKHVHGWWFDGCYFAKAMYRHPDRPNFESYAAAAKAGNPDSIVAPSG